MAEVEPHVGLLTRAVGQRFASAFPSADPAIDCRLLLSGINLIRMLVHRLDAVDEALMAEGIAPILRACDANWSSLATLGLVCEHAHTLDVRALVVRLTCVVSTRLTGFGVLGALTPSLAPKLLELAAESLDGGYARSKQTARSRERSRAESASSDRLAALRAARYFAAGHAPTLAALCTDRAMRHLGKLAAALDGMLAPSVASAPCAAAEVIGQSDLCCASELLCLLDELGRGPGPKERLRLLLGAGVLPPLAAVLRLPYISAIVVPFTCDGNYAHQLPVRALAARVLDALARASGSTGRTARAQLWSERAPSCAFAVLACAEPDGDASGGTLALTREHILEDRAHEADTSARLLHALLTDLPGMARALLGGAGDAEAAAAEQAALGESLRRAASARNLSAQARALLGEARACVAMPLSAAARAADRRCANAACPRRSAEVALLLCARCKGEAYCSSECQRACWQAHKALCSKPPPVGSGKSVGEALVWEWVNSEHAVRALAEAIRRGLAPHELLVVREYGAQPAGPEGADEQIVEVQAALQPDEEARYDPSALRCLAELPAAERAQLGKTLRALALDRWGKAREKAALREREGQPAQLLPLVLILHTPEASEGVNVLAYSPQVADPDEYAALRRRAELLARMPA